MNLDAHVTASEAVADPAMKAQHVTIPLICMWRKLGKLRAVGKRGRSPLYRWGDILTVEAQTRMSGKSHRNVA